MIANIEAERSVIGGVMVAPGRWVEVEDLRPEDFAAPAHQAIWRAMRAVVADQQALDGITIRDRLRSDQAAEALRVAEEQTISAEGLLSHARLVRDAAIRRRIAEACSRGIDLAQDEGLDRATLRAEFEKLMLAAMDATTVRGPGREMVDVYASALRRLEERALTGRQPGLPFLRLPKLDRVTLGMPHREVTILAGKTGRGKSALGWQVATNLARAGVDVLGFTLEMEPEAISTRQLAAQLKVDSTLLHEVLETRGPEILRLGEELAQGGSFKVYDHADLSVDEIRSIARRTKAHHPELALVVVDYLQLVRPPRGQRFMSREREVAAVSSELKGMASELGVAVLALSQLSRKADEEDRPPRLSDLRESGAVEHDAGLVLLMHELPRAARDNGAIPYHLLVAKNRHGRGHAAVDLLFHPAYTSFEEWDPPPPPPEEAKPEKKPAKSRVPAQASLLEKTAGDDR